MQSPISLDPLKIPSAVVGQVVVFAAFGLIAWALLREAAKVVVKVLLFLGLALAAALWLGLLDQSTVARLLEQVGDQMIAGIKAVTHWLVRAWDQVQKP
jgi:hypothetical protein